MLSRTADSLFWLGRYSERSGNTARNLAASLRMASLCSPEQEVAEWDALLDTAGSAATFREGHGAGAGPREVAAWMTLDAANPSSIASCLEAARRNGRAVRTALTVDMWEAVNDTWIELQRLGGDAVEGDRLPGFLDWVKSRALAFNGAASDTMLRDDAWRFTVLGTILERADNTARLLDARHEAFASADAGNYVCWQSTLRALSSLRAYQHLYRTRLQPDRAAELMLLRREMPRSLRFCYARLNRTLADLDAGDPHLCSGCRATAASLLARCEDARIEAVMRDGLHGFLDASIAGHNHLGAEIAACFLSG